jgi:hypothetical protein
MLWLLVHLTFSTYYVLFQCCSRHCRSPWFMLMSFRTHLYSCTLLRLRPCCIFAVHARRVKQLSYMQCAAAAASVISLLVCSGAA